MTTPMPQACPPMWNVNFTIICGVASWRMGFSASAVTPARRSCWCPSVASGAGFVRRVPGGAWPRRRRISSSRSSPGSRPASGSSRCPSRCATGWQRPRTSRPRSIPSFAPPSGSITSTRRSHKGHERATVHPGSVTFIQRFGSAINVNLHFHCVFIEGVYLDRTVRGPASPALSRAQPPTDTDIAAVVQKISRRVIRTLRRLGYLETGVEPPVATGYDPLRDTAPELARTMAASVQQRIACRGPGRPARAPHRRRALATRARPPRLTGPRCASVTAFRCTPTPRFRRIGAISWNSSSAIRPAGPCRWSASSKTPTVSSSIPSPIRGRTAPRASRLSPLELLEKLAALVPLPHVHLVRYGGCLAPHSHLRGAILPTPRQQGLDEPEACPTAPRWSWAQAAPAGLCPGYGTLSTVSAGHAAAHRRHHAGRGHPQDPPPSETVAADPPPIAPARSRQAPYNWVA